MLIKDLHSYYRHYGTQGSVILLDFKKFFPSAPHKTIYERHNKLFFDKDIKDIANKIIASNKKDHGLPLGVEPSHVEMIALPSSIDNYLKCQLSLKYVGHYMDDYYILVPPCFNAKKLLYLIVQKASEIGLTVNRSKTKIVSIHKPFKFCKAKYTLTSSGAVFVNWNRDSVKRARRKIKTFCKRIKSNEMAYEDLMASLNGIFSYFQSYNDYNRILKLKKILYSLLYTS